MELRGASSDRCSEGRRRRQLNISAACAVLRRQGTHTGGKGELADRQYWSETYSDMDNIFMIMVGLNYRKRRSLSNEL